MLVESHFTGTGNFDRVLAWVHDDIQLMRAFDCDANAREVIKGKYQIVGNDVSWADDYGRADMIIGSPPCQPYSAAGSSTVAGITAEWRASLLRVRRARPTWVVYENTPHAPWNAVCDELGAMGYAVRICNVRAYECGAPYVRAHVFLLAAKEQLIIHAPMYKKYKGSKMPTPTASMYTEPGRFTRRDAPNLQTWISENPDIQTWPTEQWFQTIGWMPGNNESFNSLVECTGEWLMGFTNNAIRKYNFSHRTACRLIGNASLPQQAHVGLWRTSLAINRLLT